MWGLNELTDTYKAPRTVLVHWRTYFFKGSYCYICTDLDIVSIFRLSTQKMFTERSQKQREYKITYLTCSLTWFCNPLLAFQHAWVYWGLKRGNSQPSISLWKPDWHPGFQGVERSSQASRLVSLHICRACFLVSAISSSFMWYGYFKLYHSPHHGYSSSP